MYPHLRQVTSQDGELLRRVLIAAFMEDPVFRWFDPAPASRRRRLERLFGHVLEKYMPKDTVWIDADRHAAAVCVPPVTPVTAGDVRFYLGLYANRFLKGIYWAFFVETHRPRAPHYLLLYIGVAPEHQGAGLGGALLEEGLARADEEGVDAYLVASSPGSRRLYKHRVFRVLCEARLTVQPNHVAHPNPQP